MARQVEVLNTKPDDPSYTPGMRKPTPKVFL